MADRRRFLQVLGVTVASVGAAGCGSSDAAPSEGAGEGTGGASAATAGGGSGQGGNGQGGVAGQGGESGQGGVIGQGGQLGQGGQPAGGCVASPSGTAVGTPSDFAATGVHKVSAAKVLVGRDAGGVYAMSPLCTHAKCNMSGSAGQLQSGGKEIVCLCHGSVFDANGGVVQGPAFSPLPHYAVELGCDGQLYVDNSKTVPAATRLAV